MQLCIHNEHTTTTMKAFGNDFIVTCEVGTALGASVNLRTIEIHQGIIELSCGARLRLCGRIHQGPPEFAAIVVGGQPPATTTTAWTGRDPKAVVATTTTTTSVHAK